jgi:hypothetical protein
VRIHLEGQGWNTEYAAANHRLIAVTGPGAWVSVVAVEAELVSVTTTLGRHTIPLADPECFDKVHRLILIAQ